jgi:hypothetical protein
MIDLYRIIENEKILFAESFQSILDNSQLIINTPDFYKFRMKYFGFVGFFGQPPVCLGHLIQLWEDNHFLRKCNDCGQTIYVFLSQKQYRGKYYWEGCCPNCNQIKSGHEPAYINYHSKLKSVHFQYKEAGKFKSYGPYSHNDSDIVKLLIGIGENHIINLQ